MIAGLREPRRVFGTDNGVLAEHLETFLDLTGDRLPGFVATELRKYLHCGILAAGFVRVHCSKCGKDELVALLAEVIGGFDLLDSTESLDHFLAGQ